MDTITATYKIHESQVTWLTDKLARLARKAEKLGCPAVTLSWKGEELEPVLGRDGKPSGKVNRFVIAEVSGVAPHVGGWTFVATLQHADEAGTVIRTVPGFAHQVPEQYRTSSRFDCDHCGTWRLRKDTYLLRNEAGEYKQVGGNCLADFLGGQDPHAVAGWAEYALSVDELCRSSFGPGGLQDPRVHLVTWLGYCAAVARVTGRWISRKAAQAYYEASGGQASIQSTAEVAGWAFEPAPSGDGAEARERWASYQPVAEDFGQAEAALEWVKATFHSKDGAARSDFEHNLVVATTGEAIQTRSMNLAAAGVGMYLRHVEKETERKAREEAGKASVHFGAIDQRLVFWAKALYAPKELEGSYGTTYLYKLITRDGNLVTWFASRRLEDLEPGEGSDFVALIGTVKKHDEFRGEKQTVVNRVALATQKQIEKATGEDLRKRAQAKAEKQVSTRFEQLTENDW